MLFAWAGAGPKWRLQLQQNTPASKPCCRNHAGTHVLLFRFLLKRYQFWNRMFYDIVLKVLIKQKHLQILCCFFIRILLDLLDFDIVCRFDIRFRLILNLRIFNSLHLFSDFLILLLILFLTVFLFWILSKFVEFSWLICILLQLILFDKAYYHIMCLKWFFY